MSRSFFGPIPSRRNSPYPSRRVDGEHCPCTHRITATRRRNRCPGPRGPGRAAAEALAIGRTRVTPRPGPPGNLLRLFPSQSDVGPAGSCLGSRWGAESPAPRAVGPTTRSVTGTGRRGEKALQTPVSLSFIFFSSTPRADGPYTRSDSRSRSPSRHQSAEAQAQTRVSGSCLRRRHPSQHSKSIN
jgi:hypothetical protein